jgi:leucyl aminopeptidase
VVLAVGLGPADSVDADRLRRAAAVAARAAAGSKRAAVALPAGTVTQLAAIAEGLQLGGYSFRDYRVTSVKSAKAALATATLCTPLTKDPAAKAVVVASRIEAAAVHLARDLINTPPNDLHPEDFASRVGALAADAGAGVEILDEQALADAGYGGILAVGQGADSPPRLLRLAHRHPDATAHLALVGKGITFDTGGISIKPAAAMHEMKADMSGAAAVCAAVIAAARLGLAVNITGYAALAENMPGGAAQRPGDVYRAFGGRTVEVLNTDAEGRLVLADALVRAQQDDPDALVDVATLTGAAIVALGPRTAGLMANDDALRDRILAAAAGVGESFWPMDLPGYLRKSLDSTVADIANIGDRHGGMQQAGLFLKEFVDAKQPWAHLDIAGPAYNTGEPYSVNPKGGTGFAVRTLLALARSMADANG